MFQKNINFKVPVIFENENFDMRVQHALVAKFANFLALNSKIEKK